MKWFVLIGSESHIALKAAEILTNGACAELAGVFVDAAGDGRLARHAQQRGIPVYRADLLRTDGAAIYNGLAGDWLINAYGTVIVPPAVLRLFAGRALNVHPGPLPEYGGLHMNQWALRNGETRFGATIHLMDDREPEMVRYRARRHRHNLVQQDTAGGHRAARERARRYHGGSHITTGAAGPVAPAHLSARGGPRWKY
jgi:hypothetical protein